MIPVGANKFFRLPVWLAKDNLIVNTGRSSISLVQFHSHKLLQSWTLKQPRSFSCPAVYVQHQNEILCVIDKNVLVVWSSEADSLDGAKEVKFQDAIFAIIPVENQQLVVLNSGSCLLVDAAFSRSEFVMKPYLNHEENLLWADASVHDSKLFIFLLTSCKDGHKLHSLLLDMSDGQIEKLSEQVISRDSSSLQSWCIKLEDAQISFVTVWCDGQVHSYSQYNKPSVHLLTIPGVQDKELLAVEAFDSCHIVIIRFHPSSGCSYEIWDARYATRKSHKSIDLVVPGNLQVRVLNDTLFIPSSQGIVAEPLKVTFPTLSAVVGKSSNADEIQDVVYFWTPDGQLHREDVEESCSDISNSKFCTITTNKVFEEFLSKLHGQDAETVSSYLKEVKLISESKLTNLLQYMLRENHCEFSEKSSKRKPSLKNSENIKKIFVELFRIPYNDIYLQQHLRKLTSKEAMATLEILTMLLRKKALSKNSSFLYSQLVNWGCLLLFSHFEELIMSTDKEQSVLEDLFSVAIKKLDKHQEAKAPSFQYNKFNFGSSTTTNYCIECLYL